MSKTDEKTSLKAQLERLEKENEILRTMNNELSMTNQHLVAATWRERDLKNELEQSKQIIEEQNHNISESIRYAKKIQSSIVMAEEEMQTHIPDSAVLYAPKDVVSGDFPWLMQKGDHVYVAAVDCTGHGVPGAMLAMIGCLLLNDIANNKGVHDPGEMLDQLHEMVVKTLKQTEKDRANDGMDIALMRVNLSINEVVFAGAHRPLYYFGNGEMHRIKGSPYPIGGVQYRRRKPFKSHTLHLNSGDSLFLFSDGLPDQFGSGDHVDDKYGHRFMNDIAAEALSRGASMRTLMNRIGKDISNWQRDEPQLDDMLLIGLRLPKT